MSVRQRMRLVAYVAACVCCLLWAPKAHAQQVRELRVDATYDADDNAIHGSVAMDVTDVHAGATLSLWNWAARMEREPQAITDLSWRWIYPRDRSLGQAQVTSAHSCEGDVSIEVHEDEARLATHGRDLSLAFAAAHDVCEVRLEFSVQLPDRFGRIGRAHGDVSLLGPWYPIPVDANGPLIAMHRVRLRATGMHVSMGAHTLRDENAYWGRAPYVPAELREEVFAFDLRTRTGHQVRWRSSHAPTHQPNPMADNEFALEDLALVDTRRLVLDAVSRAYETCALVPGVCTPRNLDVWHVPMRLELSAEAAGVVLVSDRAFQIIPITSLRDLQRRAVVRSVFAALVRPFVERTEQPSDVPQRIDALALALVDLDEAHRSQQTESVESLVSFASFHPAIDQVLYAPQLAFSDVYFAGLEDVDGFREDVMQAFAPRLRGRRWLSAVREHVGDEAYRELLEAWLEHAQPATQWLDARAPELTDMLRQRAVQADARVNYRLVSARSEAEGTGYRHVIVIARDGDRVREPVRIEVIDAAGTRIDARVEDDAEQSELVLHSGAPFADVVIDPRAELLQSGAVASEHPRADDADRWPLRPPVVQGFNVAWIGAEQRLDGLLDFVMRRRYAMDDALGFRLESSATGWSGSARYVRGFGPKRDANGRVGYAMFGLTGMRLRESYAETNSAGWLGALFVNVGIDTRYFRNDPRNAMTGIAQARVSGIRRDDGQLLGSVSLSARMSVSRSVGWRSTFFFLAGGGATLGAAIPAEMQPLGGALLLRGYETNELVGRGRAYGVAEYRFNALSDLAFNVLHLAWLREIELALFAGGGAIFSSTLGEAVVPAVSAGGGVRFLFEYGGLLPAVLSFDVAVPILRELGILDRDVNSTRAPVAFYVSFEQLY